MSEGRLPMSTDPLTDLKARAAHWLQSDPEIQWLGGGQEAVLDAKHHNAAYELIQELLEALVLHESPAATTQDTYTPEQFHDLGCPAIADDESDYAHLADAGLCVCGAYTRAIEELNRLTLARGEAPLPVPPEIQELWDLEEQYPPLVGNRSRPRKSNQVEAPLPAAPFGPGEYFIPLVGKPPCPTCGQPEGVDLKVRANGYAVGSGFQHKPECPALRCKHGVRWLEDCTQCDAERGDYTDG